MERKHQNLLEDVEMEKSIDTFEKNYLQLKLHATALRHSIFVVISS